MKKKAIVIGAGIGGLSVAARLLSQGFNVEIFEKNPFIGGKTNFIESDDFKFDLTASIMMFPHDYFEIFQYCNKKYNDYFSITPINPLYKVFYRNGNSYKFYTDIPRLISNVKRITCKNTKDTYGFINFMSENYNKSQMAESLLLNNSFLKSKPLLKSIFNKEGLKLESLTTSYDEITKYIKNENLIDYLMFQTMYIGVSPYNSPNIYNIIPAITQFNGLFHINGGMYSYVKALEKLILDLGGQINTESAVTKILFEKRKAIGIECGNSAHLSDLVVCGSDYSYTIDSLIQDKKVKSSVKSVDKFNYSCSTFVLYLGLDKKYPNLNIHNIYINKDFRENIEAAFEDRLPKYPSLYIYCPSSLDNSMCKDGYETINITVRVPNLIDTHIKWDRKTIGKVISRIMKSLSNIDGLEDIRNHIVFQRYLTPLDFLNKFNTFGGSAFGLSHELTQSLNFRPQCKLPKIDNLYFTGASIHPGNGVAMVLKSSKICVEEIIKNTTGQ